MSPKIIIFLIAIVLILVLAFGGLRRGPRVTQITRTVEKEDGAPKDEADA